MDELETLFDLRDTTRPRGSAAVFAQATTRRLDPRRWLVAAALVLFVGVIGIVALFATRGNDEGGFVDSVENDQQVPSTTTGTPPLPNQPEAPNGSTEPITVTLRSGSVVTLRTPAGYELTAQTPGPQDASGPGGPQETVLLSAIKDGERVPSEQIAIAVWAAGDAALDGYQTLNDDRFYYDASASSVPDPDWNYSVALAVDDETVVLVNGKNVAAADLESVASTVRLEQP